MVVINENEAPISRALGTEAQPRTLTTWKLVGLLIATLTPLAVLSATLPLGLAFGGPSTAIMFVAAGVVYALFSVGYSAMVRRISRPGAFYNYIARGLGRPAGVGGAMMASFMYAIGLIGAWAAGAYAITQMLAVIGIGIDWGWTFVILLVVIGFMVWRQIELNAIVSMIVVGVELLIITTLVVSIVIHNGAAAFPLDVVSPEAFKYGDPAVAFIFAILVFQGFESGALYAPEAKRPEKTVPRALFTALLIMVVTLFTTSWVLTSLVPIAELQGTVLKAGLIGFILGAVQTYLGSVGLTIFAIAVVIAILAVTAAATNFQARYLNGLAKDDLLPRFLARTNKHGAPATSAFTLMAISTLVTLICTLAGLNVYTQLTPIAFGIGTAGAMLLLIVSSVAVLGYFLRRTDRHWWSGIVAPILATVLLIVSFVAVVVGFEYITGSSAAWSRLLPVTVAIPFIGGVIFAFWLKRNRRDIYDDIATGDTAEEALEIRRRRIAGQEERTRS